MTTRKKSGWIGIDLDGTLAYHEKWVGPEDIGEPIEPMVARAKRWLKEGYDVRIFTARASDPNPVVIPAIERWCLEHIGQILPITCTKDYHCIEMWDDRGIHVMPNTGQRGAAVSRVDGMYDLDHVVKQLLVDHGFKDVCTSMYAHHNDMLRVEGIINGDDFDDL